MSNAGNKPYIKGYDVSEIEWLRIFPKESFMIPKKVKCLHCGEIIDVNVQRNHSCTCNTVVIAEGRVYGTPGTDWTDVSPMLLNE